MFCFLSLTTFDYHLHSDPTALLTKMGPKKKKKTLTSKSEVKCIIHFPECKDHHVISGLESRFEKVQEIAKKRQAQPLGALSRYNNICHQIPKTFSADAGYHR